MNKRLNGFVLIQTMSSTESLIASIAETARLENKRNEMRIATALQAQQAVLNELLERVAELQEGKP